MSLFASRSLCRLAAVALLVPVLGATPVFDERPTCVRALVAMTAAVDTAGARAGDSFGFRTIEPVTASDGTVIPAETKGFGVVAISQHAARGGRGGYVVLETRYVALANGAHMPVIVDWATAARATATGASQNIPGIVGAVPLVGYVLGPYAYLHHGKDVIIPRDARIPVIIGDDVASGGCRMRPTPAPAASPYTPAAPAPSPPTTSATRSPSPAP
jgi:hypothetical protein